MKSIAIFASGSGTNAQNIAGYFSESNNIKVNIILTNNKNAYVIERAKKLNIPFFIFSRHDLYSSDNVLNILKKNNINLIVLAGFLWFVPDNLTNLYENKIINIHPALLPKFGGKGMFGDNVHKTVILSKEKETGITIHFVNEKYDEGEIIFQKSFKINETDDYKSIAKKIHELEYYHFPRVIEDVLNEMS